MIGFKNNADNDIFLENGQIAMARDLDAVIQSVGCVSKSLYGEMPLDLTSGIPYFQTLLTDYPDIDLFVSYLKKEIKKIPEVLNIVYLKTYIDYNTGKFSYAVVISTAYGEAQIV